jgi:hypothetical protein
MIKFFSICSAPHHTHNATIENNNNTQITQNQIALILTCELLNGGGSNSVPIIIATTHLKVGYYFCIVLVCVFDL